jgi:type VI secretion system secreted protein Hcp
MKSHRLFSVILPGAMLLGMNPAPAQVSNNIGTMRVEGVKQGVFKGGKKDAASEWISLTNFNMSAEESADARSGGAKSPRTHKPIVITKEIDAASPNLLQALNNNELIQSVVIKLTRRSSDGKPIVYSIVTLKDAVISKIDTHQPNEEVSINYKSVQIEDAK